MVFMLHRILTASITPDGCHLCPDSCYTDYLGYASRQLPCVSLGMTWKFPGRERGVRLRKPSILQLLVQGPQKESAHSGNFHMLAEWGYVLYSGNWPCLLIGSLRRMLFRVSPQTLPVNPATCSYLCSAVGYTQ